MQRSDNVRPVVIKRKKIVKGDGHHGGAWKVAYADFVTAMMAFFLMLWLLGSVEEDKRKGIADYFSETLALQSSSSGSDGIMGGSSLSVLNSTSDRVATREMHQAIRGAIDDLIMFIEARVIADETLADVMQHLAFRMTDEGAVIEVFDTEAASLFVGNSAEPRVLLRQISTLLAEYLQDLPNDLALAGHSRSFPATVFVQTPIWQMTVERAMAVKALLEAADISEERIFRVVGQADRVHAEAPSTAARNNRIEVILLIPGVSSQLLVGN